MTLDTMTLGQIFKESGYFQDVREAAQAIVKILAGQELGIGPVASMTGINIIKNRVALSANIMAAVVKRSLHYNYLIKTLDDQQCIIEFYQDGKVIGQSEFTMEDAERAKLVNKDNWRHHPRNMLFARALSNGAKWYCPDVFAGSPVYSPDELGAEIDGETGDILSIPGESDIVVMDYIKRNLSTLPGPVKFEKLIEAQEAGDIKYDGKITRAKVTEWSK